MPPKRITPTFLGPVGTFVTAPSSDPVVPTKNNAASLTEEFFEEEDELIINFTFATPVKPKPSPISNKINYSALDQLLKGDENLFEFTPEEIQKAKAEALASREGTKNKPIEFDEDDEVIGSDDSENEDEEDDEDDEVVEDLIDDSEEILGKPEETSDHSSSDEDELDEDIEDEDIQDEQDSANEEDETEESQNAEQPEEEDDDDEEEEDEPDPNPESEIALAEDEEDPDPISISNEDLEDPFKQFTLLNQLRERNKKQKDEREKRLEGIFQEITNGLPAPYITPTKFTKRRKKKTGTPSPSQKSVNTNGDAGGGANGGSSSMGYDMMMSPVRPHDVLKLTELERAMRRVSISPAVDFLKRKQRRSLSKVSPNKENMSPNNRTSDSSNNSSPDSQKSESDSNPNSPSEKKKRSVIATLRIPSMGMKKCGIYTQYRNFMTSVIGAHAYDILQYDGDVTYLIAALIRLGMFVHPYANYWNVSNNNKTTSTNVSTSESQESSETAVAASEREEAKKAYEKGDVIRRFVDDTSDESLRKIIRRWLGEVTSPRNWLEKRESRHNRVVLILSTLLINELVRQTEESLWHLADMPFSVQSVSQAKRYFESKSDTETVVTLLDTLENLLKLDTSELVSEGVKQPELVKLPTGEVVSVESLIAENFSLKNQMQNVAFEIHEFYANQLVEWVDKVETLEKQLQEEKMRGIQMYHAALLQVQQQRHQQQQQYCYNNVNSYNNIKSVSIPHSVTSTNPVVKN